MNAQTNPPAPKVEEKPLISVIGTEKGDIKAYIEDAASDLKVLPGSQKAMRLAVVRYLLDSAKITDAKMRKQVWQQFSKTPAWFGTNSSAGSQAMGFRTETKPEFENLEEV